MSPEQRWREGGSETGGGDAGGTAARMTTASNLMRLPGKWRI